MQEGLVSLYHCRPLEGDQKAMPIKRLWYDYPQEVWQVIWILELQSKNLKWGFYHEAKENAKSRNMTVYERQDGQTLILSQPRRHSARLGLDTYATHFYRLAAVESAVEKPGGGRADPCA